MIDWDPSVTRLSTAVNLLDMSIVVCLQATHWQGSVIYKDDCREPTLSEKSDLFEQGRPLFRVQKLQP